MFNDENRIVDVISSRGEKRLLVRISLLESKKELEKLGRPQTQQIHVQALLDRVLCTGLLILQHRVWYQRSQQSHRIAF